MNTHMNVGEIVVEIESQHELGSCQVCFGESGEIASLVCYDHDGHIWTIDSSGVDMENLPQGVKVTPAEPTSHEAATPEPFPKREGNLEMLAEIFMGIVKQSKDNLDFGWALLHLRWGRKLTRDGWNGARMWIALQLPEVGTKMTLPFIYMRTVTGDRVPWLASQTDILAVDWKIVDE